MCVERSADGQGIQVFRDQVSPAVTSYVFSNLKANTEYVIGVIASVNNEPRQVYKVEAETVSSKPQTWAVTPEVVRKSVGQFSVRWDDPRQFAHMSLEGFIVEYRLPNETT